MSIAATQTSEHERAGNRSAKKVANVVDEVMYGLHLRYKVSTAGGGSASKL